MVEFSGLAGGIILAWNEERIHLDALTAFFLLHEKLGGSSKLSKYMLDFQNFVNQASLIEIASKGNTAFTWSNKQQAQS
ncbi:hypothetical protein ACE6H2_018821 [Prunus campanulata]